MKKLYTHNHANITTCDDFEIKFTPHLIEFDRQGLDNHDLFDFPQNRQQLLVNWMNQLLQEHRTAQTTFYKSFSNLKDERQIESLKIPQKKNHHKFNHVLEYLGGIVQTYLLRNVPGFSKPKVAKFLTDYFALMKLLPLRSKNEELLKQIYAENNYVELLDIYNSSGKTWEWVRNLLKDVKVGEK